jgi:Cu-processing system permease protein
MNNTLFNNIFLIARLTWREAISKRLIFAVLLLSLAFVGLYLIGVYFLHQRFLARAAELGSRRGSPEVAYASITVMGMYIANFLGALLGALSAIGAISGEIESGTFFATLTKPLQRAQVLLGKWLGFASLTLLYIIGLSGSLLIGVRAITGYAPPDPVRAIALMVFGAILLLTLSILGSSLFSTLANGIVVFLLYGFAWVGGLLESIGRATDTPILETISRISQVLIPSDALWKGASYHLQSASLLESQRNFGGSNPFIGLEPVPLGLMLWAAMYIVTVLALAIWAFDRHDL